MHARWYIYIYIVFISKFLAFRSKQFTIYCFSQSIEFHASDRRVDKFKSGRLATCTQGSCKKSRLFLASTQRLPNVYIYLANDVQKASVVTTLKWSIIRDAAFSYAYIYNPLLNALLAYVPPLQSLESAKKRFLIIVLSSDPPRLPREAATIN